MQLICRLNLFELNQEIYLVTENTFEKISQANLNDLSTALSAIAAERNVKIVHIFGNPDYAMQIKQELRLKFSNNIEVEIN